MQGALTRQRLAAIGRLAPVGSGGVALARQDGEQRILAQLLVVEQILVAERDAVNPLPDQLLDAVLDQPGVPVIGEARGQPTKDPSPTLHLAQQQGAAIGADRPAVETGLDLAPSGTLKLELPRGT